MVYPASMRCLVVILLAVLAPSTLFAQKTEADLRARLVGKPLYLRGLWGKDKLEFDAAGKLSKPAPAESFTLAGIDIESVKLSGKELVLEGLRVGLTPGSGEPMRIALKVRGGMGLTKPETMTIQIKLPPDGDCTAALDAIFTDSLADLVPQMPDFWQPYAQKYFLPAGSVVKPQPPPMPMGMPSSGEPSKMAKIGGGVTPPRVLTMAEPQFTEAARADKFMGVSTINLIVDAYGAPTHIRILRPVGMGLDENAVEAVSKYTFRPAMLGDKPVAVELNVQVNFQIF